MLMAFSSVSFAKLMYVPLDEAIRSSDLIVVGTLKDISENNQGLGTSGRGEIVVEELIAGNVKTAAGSALENGDRLTLNYVENFACVMGSHRRIENEKGVFLLTLKDDGEILSQDFRSLGDLKEIKKLLRKNVKSDRVPKTIKPQNETRNENPPVYRFPANENAQINICEYSFARTVNFRPIFALLVILSSLSLYYLLYRSRFKIR